MDKKTIKTTKGLWSATKGYRGHLFVAFVFDILSSIPWIGMIFSFVGYLTLWLWLELDGVKPSIFSGDYKKAASVAGEFISGIFGFGIVPGIMMWAYFAVREHAKTEAKNKKKVLKKAARKYNNQNKQERRSKRRVRTSAYR